MLVLGVEQAAIRPADTEWPERLLEVVGLEEDREADTTERYYRNQDGQVNFPGPFRRSLVTGQSYLFSYESPLPSIFTVVLVGALADLD